MEMNKEQPKLRILMFPWLAHGHIFPFLELSKRLSTTNYFTIYLCSTTVNLHSVRSSLDDALIKLIELHLPSSPELPPLLQTTKNLPPNLFLTLLQAFQMSECSFSDIIDSVQPHLLIYDFFQPWAPKIAASRNIPSIFFATSGATPFCYHHHEYTMGTASTFPYKEAIFLRDHEKFPEDSQAVVDIINEGAGDFAFGNFTLSSDIVLMKSCPEIEEKYVDHLSVLCKKQIVSTGPLIQQPGAADDYIEIFEWLSRKKHGSTLYISFGSECFLSEREIAEIAKGLQICSEVHFLWVIRFPQPTSVEEALPVGFLEKVKERGFIVPGWAPQAKILAHPSIGGFVSHCGWSSITEALYFGVPVIAIPMHSEQPLNARVVVEAGVGVEVDRDGSGQFVGEDIAKAINKVMVENCEGVRDKVEITSEKMRENERKNWDQVAEMLLRICMKNKKQV